MAAAAQDRDTLLEEIPRLSETIGNISTELARLHNLVAGLTEDPTGEFMTWVRDQQSALGNTCMA